jgi:dTDP-4-amino-4,6-dideoxy-D-glucose acyltransferase
LSAGEGGISIGNHVHLAVYCSINGRGKVTFEDFSGLSSRVAVYSSTDDYSGAAMTNPTVPQEFTNVHSADVKIGRHVIIGAGSVVLPGVTLEEGAAIGALSLVKKNCQSFSLYMGAPAKRIMSRKKALLKLEEEFMTRKGNES